MPWLLGGECSASSAVFGEWERRRLGLSGKRNEKPRNQSLRCAIIHVTPTDDEAWFSGPQLGTSEPYPKFGVSVSVTSSSEQGSLVGTEDMTVQ